MAQTEWTHQKVWNTFFSKALPHDAYYTAIDHARKMSRIAGAQRKARGVKAGIPDWVIIYQGITLWIEQKANSTLSEHQKTTGAALIANGHRWCMCRTLDAAEQAIRDAGIPLRATLGEIQDRIAEQDVPPRKRAARKPKAEPRFTLGKRATVRARNAGVLV